MFEKLNPKSMIQAKKFAYLAVLLVPIIVWVSWLGAGSASAQWVTDLWGWMPLIFVFGLVPILDYMIGKDPANPEEGEEVASLSEEKIYRWMTLACFPLQLAMIAFMMYQFVNFEGFSLIGKIGWLISGGISGGIIAINVGHELVHKDPKIENLTGGLLLASVNYAGFKVEHVRGHHVHVSTPEDASSSRYNQSVYAFLPQALVRNFLNAWSLEAQRLKKKGKSPWGLSNELTWLYAFSAVLAGLSYAWLGAEGLLYFLLQGLGAGITLEVINYIEHYGLHRRVLENGRYERTTPAHSWNSNYLLTNLVLFHLQRHSDHHANPKRRYQVLRHYEESPQLPGGYASMFFLALIPPLWKKVMNPRVEAYYENEMDQLFRKA